MLAYKENPTGTAAKTTSQTRGKGFLCFFEIHPARFLCELLETPDVVFTVYFEKHPTLRYTAAGCKKPGNNEISGLEGQIDLVGAVVEENSYLRNLTLGFVNIFHKGISRVTTTPFLALDSSP